MEARIVRGELQKCYRGEGVNHLQNCKELAEKYAGMIRDNKVSKLSVSHSHAFFTSHRPCIVLVLVRSGAWCGCGG